MRKTAILLSAYSPNNADVRMLSMYNHIAYCTKWGFSFISINEPYSPYIPCSVVESLLSEYEHVVLIGTDILITDFDKDLREFSRKAITIQDEGTGSVNGDFIIFNDRLTIKLLSAQLSSPKYGASQYAINDMNTEHISILPPRTMQSISPIGNENRPELQYLLWQESDFSIHFHQPKKSPSVKEKITAMKKFMEMYK